MYITILIISSLLLIPGILASFIPGIPNLIYMLLVALLFGIYDHFVHITVSNIVALVALVVVTMIIDFVSGIIGSKWAGASWTSMIFGLAGLVLGSMFIPIPIIGSILGMFMGILAYELYRTENLQHANRAAMGSLLGFLAGTGIRIVSSIIFLVMFLYFTIL